MNNLAFSFINIYFLLQSSSLSVAAEAPLHCAGNATFQASYVDLTCTDGNCFGWIPAQTIIVKGKCVSDKEITYIAEGLLPPVYVSGICKNGIVSSNAYSQNVALSGECRFEDNYYGTYYSSIYSASSYATGFCQENGMSRIYFEGVSRQNIGLCR
jgi:hypothetical protein